MDSAGNRVCYCCVWKDGQVAYSYSSGNHEIDNLAPLCLEMIPPYHRFYFETISPYTFAFFMDDDHDRDRDHEGKGFVYFAILRHSLGNSHLLSFLHKLRDEFRSNRSEQFLPVVRRLVASLEGGTARAWPAMNGGAEAGTSTKAPLLARPNKQDRKNKNKKKMKDDGGADVVRDIETPEHRRSDAQGTFKSSSQNYKEKWCRQVKIILAIDAAVCLLLLVIWLVICRGLDCIR